MIRLLRLALAAPLALTLLAPVTPADAASAVMCRPAAVGAAPGPGRWVAAASGTAYQLDNQGCAVIAQADMGDAAASGLTQSSALRSFVFTTGVLTGTTSIALPSLPASAYIREIIVDNSTANAVTGGIDIGTTAGAADVVSALTCGANCLTFVGDVALLKRVFSKTAQQALFILGHTAGNSANLNVTIVFGYF
jgi:hypothetical protein